MVPFCLLDHLRLHRVQLDIWPGSYDLNALNEVVSNHFESAKIAYRELSGVEYLEA